MGRLRYGWIALLGYLAPSFATSYAYQLVAPDWPYQHERLHELLTTEPRWCFDWVARTLSNPKPKTPLHSALAPEQKLLAPVLYRTRHHIFRLRFKAMIKNPGLMLVLEHQNRVIQRARPF